MKFLVDEDLPRSIAPLIVELGYEAEDVRDVGLRGASDSQVAAYAQIHERCLITADKRFANLYQYPPKSYHGLVVLELPPHAASPLILRLVRDFFAQTQLIAQLPGRLAIVAFGRVRLRES